jgi:peptidoglycan/xylan/chitin deacetylase (PgdA/CDA1 family)
MIRSLFKATVAEVLHKSGGARLFGGLLGARREPLILGYHRVVDDFAAASRVSIPSMLITAKTLERHLDWIGRRRSFVPPETIGQKVAAGQSVDRLAAVTFDDGYRDVHEHAFPILKRKGIPAAVFVVAGTVGTAQMLVHDRLYGLLCAGFARWPVPSRALAGLIGACGLAPLDAGALDLARTSEYAATRVLLAVYPRADLQVLFGGLEAHLGASPAEGGVPMTWEMLREMRAAGITIGSHTLTHARLDREPRRVVREELAGSRRLLEDRLGGRIDSFAYPDGRFDAATVGAVALAGYRYAYTICRHRDPAFPRHTLPRRMLWERSCATLLDPADGSMLDCHVNGVFDPLTPCRRPHGRSISGRISHAPDWRGALA